MQDVVVKNEGGSWHAQPTALTLRHFATDAKVAFEQHAPFDACAQVQLLANNVAFVHTALSASGTELSRKEWRGLGDLLESTYGVKTIICDRKGQIVTIKAPKSQG